MQKHVGSFLSLRCSGDVLNAAGRLRDAEKEISESMGIFKCLKPITLLEKMKYTVVDLCAGNALTSILSVHMLPVKNAIAIDRQKRSGNYENVKRFEYVEDDIKNFDYTQDDLILIAVHPCKTADDIVTLFNIHKNIKYLIMMPCCNGSFQDVVGYGWLHEDRKVSAYDLWTLHLAQNIIDAKVKITTDAYVLSPKRNIIVAHRN